MYRLKYVFSTQWFGICKLKLYSVFFIERPLHPCSRTWCPPAWCPCPGPWRGGLSLSVSSPRPPPPAHKRHAPIGSHNSIDQLIRAPFLKLQVNLQVVCLYVHMLHICTLISLANQTNCVDSKVFFFKYMNKAFYRTHLYIQYIIVIQVFYCSQLSSER